MASSSQLNAPPRNKTPDNYNNKGKVLVIGGTSSQLQQAEN